MKLDDRIDDLSALFATNIEVGKIEDLLVKDVNYCPFSPNRNNLAHSPCTLINQCDGKPDNSHHHYVKITISLIFLREYFKYLSYRKGNSNL